MIDFSRNHFELFGVPERFAVDAEALERRYRALQSEVHPDRYATAGETERRLALQSSARVNEAYRALKDPLARAEYLLSLHGVAAFGANGAALPPEFLERQLERRESAAEALAARDAAALERLAAELAAERTTLEREIGERLDRDADWDAARLALAELKVLDKLAGDVDATLGDLES